MGKSSSSYNKKRAKVSSQDRTTKKSKSSSKRSKYRTKKVRRHDDSLSCSDDDARSLQSVSSFSFEDDSRSKRARSRTRRDVKGSKKRSRRRSYSHNSSEDYPRRKKRKATKKKNDYEPRKKHKKNASVSSISSASVGCSTCPSGGISGDEIESRKHRVRPRKRSRDESDAMKVESGTKRGRHRSPCSSSRSQGSEGKDRRGEEKVVFESSRRRLRSVIALTEEYKHGRLMDNDLNKEEITYDHDDYPCRSNDSNDGVCKRELANLLHVALEKRIGVDSGEEEEARVSNVLTWYFRDSSYGFEKDHKVQVKGSNSSCDSLRVGVPLKENENDVSGAINSQAGEDVESILRRRALENLLRFKGRHPRTPEITTNQKGKSDDNLKQSSTAKAELVQTETPKEVDATVVAAKSSSEEDVAEMVGATATQLVEEADGPLVTNSFIPSENLGKELHRTSIGNEIISAKQDVACPTGTTSVLNKPNSTSLRFHSLKSHWTLTQASASLEPPQRKLMLTESRVDKSAFRTAQTVTKISNSNGDKSPPVTAQAVTQISKSNSDISTSGAARTLTQSSHSNGEDVNTAPEPSGAKKPDSQQAEAKDGSQFEQKTMCVMRGGETVQVNYKVYIPKRAPALARRQLKR